MPDLNTCPSCRTSCHDPWHYEAVLEAEQEEYEECCTVRPTKPAIRKAS